MLSTATVDLGGALVVTGLIDTHTHGNTKEQVNIRRKSGQGTIRLTSII